jgi:hypothetical protein
VHQMSDCENNINEEIRSNASLSCPSTRNQKKRKQTYKSKYLGGELTHRSRLIPQETEVFTKSEMEDLKLQVLDLINI